VAWVTRSIAFHDDAWGTGVHEGEGGGCDESYVDGVLLEDATGGDNFGREIDHHKHHEILDKIGSIQIHTHIHYIVYPY